MEVLIKVIIKEPGEAPRVAEIQNTLEALQGAVFGRIETVTVCEDLVIICNEEGRLKGLPYNVNLFGVDFSGPIVIASMWEDEFCSLTGEPEKLIELLFGR